MQNLKGLLAVVLLFATVGCADHRPAFTQITPGYNEAVVYVYRNSAGYFGSGVDLPIKADDKLVGDVGNQGYLYCRLAPGPHKIWSRTETTSEIPFTAVGGHSYYITAAVEWGFWAGRPNLVMVPEETGKLAILSTRLSMKVPEADKALFEKPSE